MGRGFKRITKEQFEIDFQIEDDLDYQYSHIKLPIRKTRNSAGYDFFAVNEIVLKKKSNALVPTGVKAYMEPDEWLAIVIRSSLGFKSNVRLMNQVGVIDSDYFNNKDNEGHIFIALENHSDKDKTIKRGEAFAQGIFSRYLISENDNALDEREGGIGSTDRRNVNE